VTRKAEVELLAGDAVAAEQIWRAVQDRLTGEDRVDKYICALGLARALSLQDRHAEAAPLVQLAADTMSEDDPLRRIYIGQLRAMSFMAQDSLGPAERAARDAVAAADATSWPDLQGDSLMILAEVLLHAARRADAAAQAERALHVYERRGNVVGARHALALLGSRG
jgi:hypothetical protein